MFSLLCSLDLTILAFRNEMKLVKVIEVVLDMSKNTFSSISLIVAFPSAMNFVYVSIFFSLYFKANVLVSIVRIMSNLGLYSLLESMSSKLGLYRPIREPLCIFSGLLVEFVELTG